MKPNRSRVSRRPATALLSPDRHRGATDNVFTELTDESDATVVAEISL
ncbi:MULTISPECIES: hypothetical protein [Halomicrobium]|nr:MULTISPECIES: hypothetical protein [Halomicrobium]